MKKGFLYIILAAVLFSTMEIVLKMVSGAFNPLQLNFIRFFVGALVLLPFSLHGLKARNVRLNRKDFAFFALTGFICVVVSMTLYQMGIEYSEANIVAVLFSCNPVFVVLFALLILKEKVYKFTVVSLAISIAGIITIMEPWQKSGPAVGIVLTLLSAVTFALYGIMSRKKSGRFGGVAITCFSALFGSLEMLGFILITHIGGVADFFTNIGLDSFANAPILQGINGNTIPLLIYICVAVTGLGYAFYFLAMETTSAATASIVFFIKPALAPILALIILNEAITVNMFFGILLIIAGSLIAFIWGFRLRKNEARSLRP